MILRYSDYGGRARFDADVVVVGTGAGGAPAGQALASAGLRVFYVEEGGFHPTEAFNPYATESVPRLLREGGATLIHGSPVIPYVEGRCVGGSTTVNGGMSWRAPEEILSSWSELTGCPELGPAGMDGLYREVEEISSVKTQLPESIGEDSRLMALGAEKLGWRHDLNHRSQDRCVGTNNCVAGCPTGAKKSTLVSYFPKALEAGATCLTDVRVDRLLLKRGRCVGVVGRAYNPKTRRRDKRIVVRARAVVLACGAIQTPHLLLGHRAARRSKALGRNFLCHPNAKVMALYPHDVRGWQGVSQWGQIREFREDGILMAENMVAPAALAAMQPFHGERLWELMSRYNNMVAGGVLVEDSRPGRVLRGPLDIPIPIYNITRRDHERFLRGIQLLSLLHFEMGAEAVYVPFRHHHRLSSVDEIGSITSATHPRSSLDLFTVHLMGTTRMGSSPATSVTDPDGELWSIPGCHVADAGLFPTAVGVNPQLTIMALATKVARKLAARLGSAST